MYSFKPLPPPFWMIIQNFLSHGRIAKIKALLLHVNNYTIGVMLLLKSNYVIAAVLDRIQFSPLNFGTYIELLELLELIKVQTVLIYHYFIVYRDTLGIWANEPNRLAAINQAWRFRTYEDVK